MKERILVIDDDRQLLELIRVALEREEFVVLTCDNGVEGLKLAYKEHPDLVLLDLMLPQMDGMEICHRLQELSDIPIIILSAVTSKTDVVRGLTQGAKDYVTKPFHIPELVARIRIALRHTPQGRSERRSAVLLHGPLCVDLARRTVTAHGNPVSLTPTEFRLLVYLAQHAGQVIPHKTLLMEVWGPEYANQIEYLHLYMRYLRQKLERDPSNPQLIKTERGIGYYMEEAD